MLNSGFSPEPEWSMIKSAWRKNYEWNVTGKWQNVILKFQVLAGGLPRFE
jgi:hypothetical protein